MLPHERDDVLHKLQQTAAFYNKDIEPGVAKVWLRALRGQDHEAVVDAFDDYVRVGKFMPKPVDILEQIDKGRAEKRVHEGPRAEPEPTPCPPEIHAAWTWFIATYTEDSKLGQVFTKRKFAPEQEEKFLHLVNHEAHRMNMPDAIPDEYKLKEVWG